MTDSDRDVVRAPLKVCFVLTQDRGGPVDVTVALALALEGAGHDVRVVGPVPARRGDAVAHLLDPFHVGGKAAAGAIVTARRRILAHGPDVVHAQDRRAGLVCAGLGRLRPGGGRRPVVVHTYHGVPDDVTQAWLDDPAAAPPSRYTRAVLRADALVARAVDRTVVVAPPMREFLVGRLGVPSRAVVHIDNGVDLPPAAPPTGPVRNLLFVGLLVERKGVHLLLDALARARHTLPEDVTLTVVGDGPERAALQARAAATGLDGRVRFLGFRDDVPDLLARADGFVLPSLLEQQPLVLLEALGAGLPVLATDVGGVRDLVGDTGLVVPAGDVPALARGLEALTSSDGAEVGARGAQRARQRFSVEACRDHHVALYTRLLDGRTAR